MLFLCGKIFFGLGIGHSSSVYDDLHYDGIILGDMKDEGDLYSKIQTRVNNVIYRY